VIGKWWWLIKRLLVYVPLAGLVFLAHLLITKYLFVLVYLFNFPTPTELTPKLPNYSIAQFGAPIKAGFAKRDITPRRGQWVAGFMPPHPGLSIKDRLWAKFLALQDENGNIAVIVSNDVIGNTPDELDKIFSKVKLVDRKNVFVSATHTHSGPDTMGLWIWKNSRYMEMHRSQVAEGIDDAVAALQPAAIRFGQGEFKGYANGRHDNPPDPTVSVIQVLIGSSPVTLVNFASHADAVMGLQFSADFPYFLAERLKRRVGGETIFIPGAIGGVQPDFDRKTKFYFVRTLGEDLADAVVKIMKNPLTVDRVDIGSKTEMVSAPFENTGLLLKAYEYGLVNDLLRDGRVWAEVSRINIGPAEILTAPGELFPKIWWRVRPEMTGKQKMIFGLTNGEFGYILLPEDTASGHHKYCVSVSVGPTFGEEIYKALKRLASE